VSQSGQTGNDGDQPKATYPNRLRLASQHYAAAAKEKYEVARQYVWKALQTVGRGLAASLRWIDTHNGLLTAAATVAIAFLTYYVARFTYEQGQITNRQLAVMEADQRPWIATTIEPAESLAIGPDSARLKFKYSLENTGRTPAFNVVPIPEIIAQMSGGYPQYLSLQQPFMPPINPIVEVKKSCDKYGPDINKFIAEGITLLFGNTIFPQKVILHEEIAEIHFPAANQNSLSPSLNNIGQIVLPRTMIGSVYLVSCVVYRASNGTKHHQTGDVFYIQRIDPNNPDKTIDIDLTIGGVVPKGELRLIPEALGAYAN
jgi:hypothetical protein